MKVWILLLFVSGMEGNNMTAIDNLVSESECQRLGQSIVSNKFRSDLRFRCFEAEKAK